MRQPVDPIQSSQRRDSQRNAVLFAAIAWGAITLGAPSVAEAVPCKQTCGAGETCSPKGECISRCNPVCASNELCSPEATCVSACNPGCAASEVCSPEKTCVSRCNPSCTGGAACLADGTCEAPAAPLAPAQPTTRTLVIEPREPRTESITGLIIAGTVIWSSAYVAGVVASTIVASDTGGDVGLTAAIAAIPLVGPWIGIPVADNLTGPMLGGIIGVGVTQALGFTLLMVGIGGQEVDSSSSFQIVPTFGTEHGTGLSAVGTF